MRLVWLIIAALLCAAPIGTLAATNDDGVAVIIGNRDYKDIPDVDFAVNDADAFKRFVVDVLGYDTDNIIDLRNATKAQLEAAFGNDRTPEGRLWRYLDPEGRSDVVVFYSGHGVPGLKDQRGYLLPVNADPDAPEINGYPVDQLYRNLAKLKARSITVLLDACFSGETQKGMVIRATSGISVTPKLPASSKLTILTAAQGDQVASWDEPARHGLFTNHVLDALYGAADKGRYGNGDGKVALGLFKAQKGERLGPVVGEVFKDCDECPEMVVVPAGTFQMGSNDGHNDEKPVHRVTIPRPFAVGKYEVTFSEWDACVAARGCSNKPGDSGWGRGHRPAINVDWDDAQEYVKWLSRRTRKSYRLLSEAEWEYAAQGRAGSQVFGKGNANCRGCGSRWDNKQTAPVGSFRPNGFGLHDMLGNAWEWTQDCSNGSYSGAPTDGSAWTSGDCSRRVLRGGSWDYIPRGVRSAIRSRNRTTDRYDIIGFRISRTHP